MVRGENSDTLCSSGSDPTTHSSQAFDVPNFSLRVWICSITSEYGFKKSQSGEPSNVLASNYHSCSVALQVAISSPHIAYTHPLVWVRKSLQHVL